MNLCQLKRYDEKLENSKTFLLFREHRNYHYRITNFQIMRAQSFTYNLF